MEVYVILTDGEGARIREKGIKKSNEASDTVTRSRMVGVIGCELYYTRC